MARKSSFYFTRLASCFTTVCSLILMLTWIFGKWQSHVEDDGIKIYNQGNALIKAGDPASLQRATQTFQKAAETFHGMENKDENRNEGLSYYNLARAYHALKQNEQAIAADLRALPLLTDAKSKTDQADTYNNLGVYYLQTKQSEKAMDAYTHAQPLYEAAGLKDKVQKVVYVQGDIRYNQGIDAIHKQDWTTARNTCQQAQQLYHQAIKPAEEADAYHELSVIYAALGDAPHAAEAHQQEQVLRPQDSSSSRK